jgi:hypothetical protein
VPNVRYFNKKKPSRKEWAINVIKSQQIPLLDVTKVELVSYDKVVIYMKTMSRTMRLPLTPDDWLVFAEELGFPVYQEIDQVETKRILINRRFWKYRFIPQWEKETRITGSKMKRLHRELG